MREQDVTLGDLIGMIAGGTLGLIRCALILTGQHQRKGWYR